MPEQTPKSRRRRALGPGLAGMILTVAALAGLMFNGMGRGSPGSVSSLVAADPSVCATSGVASGCSPDPTTTAITDIAPAKPTVGQPVTVDVTVSPSSPGSGTPTGSAVVSDGSQSCTAQLSAGSGSCQLSESAVGTYTLTAAYGGDGNFGSSTSAGTKVSVSKEATVTGLGLSVLSVGYGSGVLENAYVTVTPQFAGTATGTVQVTVDGGYECYLLLAGGEAVCAFDASELPPGTHTVKAIYYGDTNFKSSKSPGIKIVVSEKTTTALSLSASTVTYGSEQEESISVTVSPQVAATISGTVTITASGNPVCKIHLSSNAGTCTLPKKALAAGSYSVIATYAGTSVYDESASSPAPLTISP